MEATYESVDGRIFTVGMDISDDGRLLQSALDDELRLLTKGGSVMATAGTLHVRGPFTVPAPAVAPDILKPT